MNDLPKVGDVIFWETQQRYMRVKELGLTIATLESASGEEEYVDLETLRGDYRDLTPDEQWRLNRPAGCHCPFGVILGDCSVHGDLVPME